MKRRGIVLSLALAAVLLSGPSVPAQEIYWQHLKGYDVPYVPTPVEVVDEMLRLVDIKPGDLLYDLGCGDGRIVVAAAQRFGIKAVGIDKVRLRSGPDCRFKMKQRRATVVQGTDATLGAPWFHVKPSAPGSYDWFLKDYADRLINWTYAGVPGGIPNRTTVYTTLNPGATAAQIIAAIGNCPAGQVVQLGEGTFNISTMALKNPSQVTLRGAGPGKTIINSSGAGLNLNNAGYISPNPANWSVTRSIASGYTKGSMSITLSSAPTSAWTVGNLMMITQADDQDLVYTRSGNWAGTQNKRFTTRITGVRGKTVTFATPIPHSYSASQTPICTAAAPEGGVLFGVEDLTINCSNANPFTIAGGDRCWAKNVEVSGAEQAGFYFWASSQCEVRRCYVHDSYGFYSQADGYSFLLQYGNSYCRVEDNIAYRTAHMIMNGSSGNVVAYNYFWETSRAGVTWVQPALNCNHGAHGLMNLIEGNVGSRFQNDGYHGSGSHNTIFRNWFNGLHPSFTMERQIVDLCRGSYYHNVVGNVLGASSWDPTAYQMTGSPGHSSSYIYQLGYPNPDNASYTPATTWTGWTDTLPDARVASTLLRHGNYDYYNDAVVWDRSLSARAIPNSLLYDSKPSYFGSLAWPAIGPDLGTMVNDIPAKARWDRYVISADLDDLFADEK